MKCTSCSGEVVYDDSMQAYVCTKCGLMLDDHPIVADYPRPGHEPRYSGGFTHRLHYHGVGDTVAGPVLKHLREGRSWMIRHFDALNHGKTRLIRALKALNDLVKLLNAPRAVAETASQIITRYVGSLEKGKTVLREQRARELAAASLLMAFKIHGYPATLIEVSRATGCNQQKLWKRTREICGATGIKLNALEPSTYIRKIASALNAPPDVEELARVILSEANQSKLLGGSRVSLAAGAVYLSSILLNKRVPQSRFKETGLISTAGSFRKIIELVDIEVVL